MVKNNLYILLFLLIIILILIICSIIIQDVSYKGAKEGRGTIGGKMGKVVKGGVNFTNTLFIIKPSAVVIPSKNSNLVSNTIVQVRSFDTGNSYIEYYFSNRDGSKLNVEPRIQIPSESLNISNELGYIIESTVLPFLTSGQFFVLKKIQTKSTETLIYDMGDILSGNYTSDDGYEELINEYGTDNKLSSIITKSGITGPVYINGEYVIHKNPLVIDSAAAAIFPSTNTNTALKNNYNILKIIKYNTEPSDIENIFGSTDYSFLTHDTVINISSIDGGISESITRYWSIDGSSVNCLIRIPTKKQELFKTIILPIYPHTDISWLADDQTLILEDITLDNNKLFNAGEILTDNDYTSSRYTQLFSSINRNNSIIGRVSSNRIKNAYIRKNGSVISSPILYWKDPNDGILLVPSNITQSKAATTLPQSPVPSPVTASQSSSPVPSVLPVPPVSTAAPESTPLLSLKLPINNLPPPTHLTPQHSPSLLNAVRIPSAIPKPPPLPPTDYLERKSAANQITKFIMEKNKNKKLPAATAAATAATGPPTGPPTAPPTTSPPTPPTPTPPPPPPPPPPTPTPTPKTKKLPNTATVATTSTLADAELLRLDTELKRIEGYATNIHFNPYTMAAKYQKSIAEIEQLENNLKKLETALIQSNANEERYSMGVEPISEFDNIKYFINRNKQNIKGFQLEAPRFNLNGKIYKKGEIIPYLETMSILDRLPKGYILTNGDSYFHNG